MNKTARNGGISIAIGNILKKLFAGTGLAGRAKPSPSASGRETSPIEALESRMLLAFGPVGGEIRLGASYGSVAIDGSGNFVTVGTNTPQGMVAQRYDSAGNPLGAEIMVNSTGGDSPVVAMNTGGQFVIAWRRYDPIESAIFAQRFEHDGQKLGGEFRVDAEHQAGTGTWNPRIGMDDAGRFVVAWTADNGFSLGLFADPLMGMALP